MGYRWRQALVAGVWGALCAGTVVSGALANDYEGVAPGSPNVPAHLAAPPGEPVVTWPGFQMTPDGGSLVFVQAGQPVTVERKDKGSKLVLILPGMSLPAGNTRRPLETSFFNTPVTRVHLKKHKKGVALVLHLRSGAEPQVTTESAPSGYHFVMVRFAPGEYLTGK